MWFYRKPFLLLILFTILFVTTLATYRKQDKDGGPPSAEAKLDQRLSKLPVAEYDAQESPDPEKREKRRAKSKKYDDAPGYKIDPTYKFTHQAIRSDWELGLLSPLPAAQSSAIIVGRVAGLQAFLSNDRNNVYSEFTVQVEEVIKNSEVEPISAGDAIAVERLGGRVRTPSGHVQSYTVSGQGTPELGRRYVFFLGHNPRETGFGRSVSPGETSRNVLTAYELRAGKVLPLDYAGGRDFNSYAGENEAAFLNQIRRAVAEPSQPQH